MKKWWVKKKNKVDEAVFEVELNKGSRGLGLSVTGGADSAEPWPGLVRVKRLFPHQPAWQDGRLAPGDVLLEANGIALTGLTNYEALEVLRTAPSLVTLRVCRPPAGTGLSSVAPEDVEHPLPPPRHRPAPLPPNKSTRPPASDIDDDDDESSTNSLLRPISEQGEFEISLTKVAGSLGFTLRKEDESVLGHYVRALVREPAVSDGRVKPGDRIVAVNGVDISPMSHEEAVAFLRKCGETVTLRLYRDKAQTPIAALSPTDGCKTFPRSRPMLRDLAGRKLAAPHDTTGRQRRASEGHPPAPVPTPSVSGPSPSGTSPRRRRLARTPPSPVTDAVVQHNVADVVEETGRASLKLSLQALASLDSAAGESTPRERPSSLDLSTPSSLRKQKFLFTSPPESATFSEFGDEDDSGSGVIAGLSPPNEYPGPSSLVSQPASMPPMRIDNELAPFSHRNPAYQSAAERPVTVIGEEGTSNQLCATQASPAAVSDQDIPRRVFGQEGPQGLIKWKGIVFTPENEEAPKTPSSVTSSVPGKSKSTTPTTPKPFVKLEDRDGQVLTVELTRGWNSRLGFTLHAGEDGKTLIKAIYPDSVAHRDGRLKQGDHVVMVNEESIEHLPTSEVIDLVRKIRGTVAITILRPR
ncbi:hypothetical protein B566_EDAN003802 [Ephemera danica]|nr:hypothetical protein B566_EDAN003802 [Ephemera danica]